MKGLKAWRLCAMNAGGGGGLWSGSVKSNCEELRDICGTMAGKWRCRDQTSRSLKEQQFCTDGSECLCVSSDMVRRYHNYGRRPSVSPRNWSMNPRQVDIVI